MRLFSAEQRQRFHSIVAKFFRPLVAVVLLLIGGGGWWFIIWPQVQRLQTSGLLIYDERVRLRDAKQQQLDQLKHLEQEYDDLHAESLRALEFVLPEGFDEAAMIATMEEFAQQADVHLQNITITTGGGESAVATSPALPAEKGAQVGAIRTATISITVEMNRGDQPSYFGLKKFLKAMESFVPLMDLRDLSFSSDQTTLILQLQTPYLDSSSLR